MRTTTAFRAIATCVCLLGAGSSLASVDGTTPAELPPAEFTGRQFVDSQGCVFIRAEVSGAVTWVPRMTRDREVLCGFQPTFAEGTAAATGSLPSVSPDAPPDVSAAAPAAVAKPVADAPKPDAVPQAEAMAAPAAEAAAPPKPRPTAAPARSAVKRKPVVVQTSGGLPKGYRPVWTDDRLNPHRGKGTPEGEASMRRIWSDSVPMRLVAN